MSEARVIQLRAVESARSASAAAAAEKMPVTHDQGEQAAVDADAEGARRKPQHGAANKTGGANATGQSATQAKPKTARAPRKAAPKKVASKSNSTTSSASSTTAGRSRAAAGAATGPTAKDTSAAARSTARTSALRATSTEKAASATGPAARPVVTTGVAASGGNAAAVDEGDPPYGAFLKAPAVMPAAAGVPASELERKIASGLAFLRRRITGDYEVDEFGMDPELMENITLPMVEPFYNTWFRVETFGVHNIPKEGPGLLVANHAGGLWAADGVITATAVRKETNRYLRMLGADLVFTTPGLAPFARKNGCTLACNADAERLFSQNQLVGVWPEGFKGIGKRYRERYKLQRFGRGGFVTAALRSGAPIVPVSIVGSEEIHPVLGNAKTLARLLNLPYFPLTPTFPWLGPLGFIPLPSKWYIEFGEPISTAEYGPEGADDPMLVFELTDRVRETIQSTLYRLLVKRRSVWR